MSVNTNIFTAPARAEGADYEPFCLVVRRLCGIDLLQYKRGQMERRIRSFVTSLPEISAMTLPRASTMTRSQIAASCS